MKSLKWMLLRYLLLILIPSIVIPTIAQGNEQWREAIEKDYRKVLKEKKPEKQVNKHRDCSQQVERERTSWSVDLPL